MGDGRQAWRAVGFPTPRPLYRLPDILAKPDASVLVTEGEKAADAAGALFANMVATTPPHGAKSPSKADWGPLKGRTVGVWPDADSSGADYAQDVVRLASAAGAASVAIVEVPADFPKRWDLANPLPNGWTVDGLRELLGALHRDPDSEIALGNLATMAAAAGDSESARRYRSRMRSKTPASEATKR